MVERDALPAESLTAGIPVSVRPQDDEGGLVRQKLPVSSAPSSGRSAFPMIVGPSMLDHAM